MNNADTSFDSASGESSRNLSFSEEAAYVASHNRFVHPGSVTAGVLSFTAGTLGAAVFALPAGFQASGWVLSFVQLFIVGIFTVLSVRYLVLAIELTDGRCFEDLCQILLGDSFETFSRWLLIVLTEITLVGYVLLFRDFLLPYLPYLKAHFNIFEGSYAEWYLVLVYFCLILIPLLLQPSLGHVRFASAFAIFMLVYVSVTVSYRYFVPLATQQIAPLSEIHTYRISPNMFLAMPIMMLAFDAMPVVFQIHAELDEGSVRNVTKVGVGMLFLSGAIYVWIGIFGYLSFGDKVQGNILSNYDPHSDPLIAIAYLGCCFSLTMCYVLNTFPMRDCILNMMIGYRAGQHLPYRYHAMVTLSIAFSSVILASLFPSIVTVVALLGSIGGSSFLYLFPAVYVIQMRSMGLYKPVHWLDMPLVYATAVLGIVSCILGTITTVHDMSTR